MHIRTIFLGLAAALAIAPPAWAEFPDRPIHIIAPFAPGGNIDVTARIVGDKLREVLGVSVIVENKAGASGMIGSDAVARAAPDGYTLLAASSGPVSIAPSLQKLPYAPLTDLSPVSVVAVNPFALVTYPSFPANNAREFIAKLKAEPGRRGPHVRPGHELVHALRRSALWAR